MTDQKPSVGRMVHYVSYGTPGSEYTSQCRAAIIAGCWDDETCDLVVINPTGLFFNRAEHQDPLGTEDRAPGTWHWPERV